MVNAPAYGGLRPDWGFDLTGMSKAEAIQELYRRLSAEPPASSMAEAYAMIDSLLNQVESERRGIPLSDDLNALGLDRMMIQSLTPENWTGLDGPVAHSEMKSGRITWLYEDGAIKVTRDIEDRQRITEFWKEGGRYMRSEPQAEIMGGKGGD